jgi:hypothetical protein
MKNQQAIQDGVKDVFESVGVRWIGLRPMLMNNGRGVDRLNPLVKELSELNTKRSKDFSDADFERRDWLQWHIAIYESEGRLMVPTENIEQVIVRGAQKARQGKQFQAACFVATPTVWVKHDGPNDIEQLYDLPQYKLRVAVVINKTRVMKVRVMVPTPWSIEFTVEFDRTVIKNKEAVLTAMRNGGALIGLNDWRPKYGRFLVEELI